ncbi:CWF19-like protein DRN1 [Spathaspora sp. JA1]|nr:CWF19-like protein DRN1 [Spathaspora sp. JA1]
MTEKSKFLILNPSPDNLDSVLVKSNLQYSKNGPFAATILLGDVLPVGTNIPQVELQGTTYFCQGKNGISESVTTTEEISSNLISKNLTYVSSPVNIIKLTSGLVIMMISGNANEQEIFNQINQVNVKVDILITYEWPQTIAHLEQLTLVGSEVIDQVIKSVKPRYHFAVGNVTGKFFELEPFAWDSSEITRFISLAQEGTGSKWFYAFTLSHIQEDVAKIRENPFTTKVIKKRALPEVTEDNNTKEVTTTKKIKTVSPDSCFFCLGNPKTEAHMIVSIGTHSYLTIAKGPLTRSNRNLFFSGHGILIPIQHIPCIRSNSEVPVQESPIYKEIMKYQHALVSAFFDQKPDYRLVFFEISRLTNVHLNIQFMPVEFQLLSKFVSSLSERTRANNTKFTKNHKLNFQKFTDLNHPDLIKIINESDYIMFTIWSSINEPEIHITELEDSSKPIDIQFPRRVLADTLNLRNRVYWDKCQQPKIKEVEDCENFKKFLHNYDFTIS